VRAPPVAAATASATAVPPSFNWVRDAGAGLLIVLLLMMLALGVYPSPFVRLAQGAGIGSPSATAQ
jgi:hypothetical protein